MRTTGLAHGVTPIAQRILRTITRCTIGLAAVALMACSSARAQCPEAWVPGVGTPGASNTVNALAVIPGGDLILGGTFGNAGSTFVSRIARYSPSTGAFSALLGGGTNNTVNALAVVPGGDVIVGGTFTTAGPVSVSNLARYNPSSGVWSSVGNGVSGAVNSIAVLPGGDFFAAGSVLTVTNLGGGTLNVSNIARFNPINGTWSALGAGTSGPVNAMAVLPNGDLLVGGNFANAAGVLVNNLARYNPTTGVWSAVGSGANGVVNSLLVLPSGDVIVGGNFTVIGLVPANRIARLNTTTNTFTALGSGTDGAVNALAALGNGDVVAGGAFGTAGGVTVNRIARCNLTTNTWTALGTGTGPGTVLALAVGTQGDLFVGGSFTTVNGVGANRIARYFPGAPAPTIVTQPLPVVTTTSGNALFFTNATGGSGSGTPTYQWRKGGVPISSVANPSAATPVLSIASVQSTDLGSYDCLVTNSCGGTGTASNSVSLSFATIPQCRLADIASLGGNLVPDGQKTVDDLLAFLASFFSGCP